MTARPTRRLALQLAAVPVAFCLCALGVAVQAQAPASHAASAAKPASAAASHPAFRGGRAGAPQRTAGPTWRELPAGQQKSLAPLAAQWDLLSEAQKRKWIAMSANYPKMSAEEQTKLHSRMTEWVGLSAQQRSAARLNYGETKKLAVDDKKAKWEAYQALPPEEKKKLAAGAQKPPATAAAVRPVPREKLASVPQPQPQSSSSSKAPRIAAAPNQLDHNTLLPQQPIPDGGGSAN